jgi:hypothetical protein
VDDVARFSGGCWRGCRENLSRPAIEGFPMRSEKASPHLTSDAALFSAAARPSTSIRSSALRRQVELVSFSLLRGDVRILPQKPVSDDQCGLRVARVRPWTIGHTAYHPLAVQRIDCAELVVAEAALKNQIAGK